VEQFLQAKNNDEMEFCLMVANHDGFRIFHNDWETIVDLWIPYLKSDRSVKVDGKPVIIFFTGLAEDLGGSDEVQPCLDYFQKKAKEAGLPGVFVAVCLNPDPLKAKEQFEKGKAEGYDGFTGYNYVKGYHYKGSEPFIHTYEELVKNHTDAWDLYAKESPLPYMPIVTCGWDCRPWEGPDRSPRSWYYPDRTPKQVYEFLSAAKQWLDDNASKAVEDKIVLLYAWNEYGEGGYIAPTKGDQGSYLEAIKKAK
jgi:hypothetical protein